jgi:hypothetical protein
VPSIATSHFYTFVALTTISTILIFYFSAYASSTRATPKVEVLKEILDHVAAEGNQLVTLVTTTNSTAHLTVQLPSAIGNQEYWIRVRNDSSEAWIEGGLGHTMNDETSLRVFLIGKISTSGHYLSGYGPAILECYMNGSVPQLNLSSLGGVGQ